MIARTATEEGLSAPISFESLKSQSLPLERSDVITQDVDVVKVSLVAALQFIVSLDVREDLAILKTKDELPLDTSLCPYPPPKRFEENDQVSQSPEAWADALVVAAEIAAICYSMNQNQGVSHTKDAPILLRILGGRGAKSSQ